MRARMSCTVAVLLLALGVLAHAADEYEQQATVAHKHHMVNPPSSDDDECPHHSGKVYYREGGDHDKAYEAAYDADDEAALEYSGHGHHHHDLADPRCGQGRVRGVVQNRLGLVSLVLGPTNLPATITDVTLAGANTAALFTSFTVNPRNESDKCAGVWSFGSNRNLRWTAGSLTIATADGTTPSNFTITGSFGQPASKDRVVAQFNTFFDGPNKQALDVCFTPPKFTTCRINIAGTFYQGTIDTAVSSDIDGPTTVSDWIYRGDYLQVWPGAKHATFVCTGLSP